MTPQEKWFLISFVVLLLGMGLMVLGGRISDNKHPRIKKNWGGVLMLLGMILAIIGLPGININISGR